MIGIAELEAIIFASGKEGVDIDHLQRVFDLKKSELSEILELLNKKYQDSSFGIELKRVENILSFGTKKEVYPSMIQFFSKPKQISLTQVQLETLAMIAYEQPITKQRIEEIRGVKSDYAVNKLLEYGLVEECGRLEAPGKPILFKTSLGFLKEFGLESVEEIPRITQEELEALDEEINRQVALKNSNIENKDMQISEE